jgi:hypothetical protein
VRSKQINIISVLYGEHVQNGGVAMTLQALGSLAQGPKQPMFSHACGSAEH